MRKMHNSLDFEIEFYERIVKQRPNYFHALLPLAEAYTAKKLYRKGLAIDKRLAKLDPTDPVIHYNLACSFALVGDKESALKALKKAIRFGYDDFEHMKKDKDLHCFHQDPAFLEMMGDEWVYPLKRKDRRNG